MIDWMEGSWLGQAMFANQWVFPLTEAFHFFGLCLLIGSIAVMDLRLLGFARPLSIRAVHQLVPWAWLGFGINLITGVMFIFSQASFYFPNPAFRIKMILILLAGLNALWFQFRVNPQLAGWDDDADAPGNVKAMAAASLALWIGVIFFGRFIMYWPPI